MTGLGAVHVSVLELTQELQKCAVEEFSLFRDYKTVVAHEVKVLLDTLLQQMS